MEDANVGPLRTFQAIYYPLYMPFFSMSFLCFDSRPFLGSIFRVHAANFLPDLEDLRLTLGFFGRKLL